VIPPVGLLLVPILAGSGPGSLESVCPVDWRGATLGEALAELAPRLEVPYILDVSVDAAALNRRVRMSASHLTGAQAFRWLARSAGLEAALVDGTFLIAAEDRLPAVWRSTGTGGGNRRPSGDDGRWRLVQERRADLRWIDSPLSGVARDISAAFGVDVVFHQAILADQPLVGLEASQVGFDRVRQALAGQLAARVEYVDGAVWVRPRNHSSSRLPSSRPWSDGGQPRASTSGPLTQPVRIGPSAGTWSAFAGRLAEAGRLSYRVEAPPATPYPTIEAAGSVAAVLEAARLLGWLSWSLEETGEQGGPRLRIEVRQAGRDSR